MQRKNILQPLCRDMAFCSLVVSLVLIASTPAYAVGMVAPGNDILCAMANFAIGNFGRGLATIGILAVGVGATLGKVTWTMAITVAVGISTVFGAGVLVANYLAPAMGYTFIGYCG